jgi:hypothetical protein
MVPLFCGGAISAMYMGAIIKDAPTPSPPSILAKTRLVNPGANAEHNAESRYRIAATRNILLLPYLSLKGPASNIASVAVSVRQLTDHPNCIFDKLNSVSMNFTTPEITEASNPIKNPPKATINETFKIYRKFIRFL